MSTSQVWAALCASRRALERDPEAEVWWVITRDAESTHWEHYISNLDQDKALRTADALNEAAIREQQP